MKGLHRFAEHLSLAMSDGWTRTHACTSWRGSARTSLTASGGACNDAAAHLHGRVVNLMGAGHPELRHTDGANLGQDDGVNHKSNDLVLVHVKQLPWQWHLRHQREIGHLVPALAKVDRQWSLAASAVLRKKLSGRVDATN